MPSRKKVPPAPVQPTVDHPSPVQPVADLPAPVHATADFPAVARPAAYFPAIFRPGRGGVRKILVLRLRYIGDVILTGPFLAALAEVFPNASVTFMTDRICSALLAECPFIDGIIEYDRRGKHKSLYARISLARQLRSAGFDTVFVLQRSLSSALFAFATGALIRVGFDTDARGILLTHRVYYDLHRYEAEAFLDNLRILGIRPFRRPLATWEGREGFESVDAFLDEASLGQGRPLAIVNPGPSASPKAWEASRFAEITGFLAGDLNMKVVVTWGPGEEEDARRIVKLAPSGAAVIAPPTGLAELARLISRAALMVTTDTGPMHMAVAKGIPTVTIFGPTDPVKWNPPDTGKHKWVKGTPPCWPCDYDHCVRGHVCMKSVGVREVREKILEILEQETAWSGGAIMVRSSENRSCAERAINVRVIDARAAERFSGCRKVLAVQTSSLGEVVLLVPALRTLRAAMPDAGISCLVRESTADVLKDQGIVDEIIVFDKGPSAMATVEMARRLSGKGFDLALLFNRSFRSALMATLAGIPERVGVAAQVRGLFLTCPVPDRCNPLQHEMDKNLDVLRVIGFEPEWVDMTLAVTGSARNAAGVHLKRMGIRDGERIIGIWPGAGWASRRWPAGNFAEAARRLLQSCRADRVMVMWGLGEEILARNIVEGVGSSAAAPDDFVPLATLPGLLARCALLLTNDTGPMHLANALGVPVVVPMGPTEPRRWGPATRFDFSSRKDFETSCVRSTVCVVTPCTFPGHGGEGIAKCFPCGKKNCLKAARLPGFVLPDRASDCMASIRVSACVAAAVEILDSGRFSRRAACHSL